MTGFARGYPRLQVKLARKDRDHLVMLHEALKANRPIRDSRGILYGKWRPVSAYRLLAAARGRRSCSTASRSGRLHTLQPWDGPAHLMPHYWRGLFDGDGSITINGTASG